MNGKTGFSTRAIHAGEKKTEIGAMVPPIYQTAPFVFKDAAHGARLMSGKEKGYVYSRGLNPTTEVLEEKIADLEGGEAALAQASGMAAISAAVLASVKAGDHVIADEVIYGSTYDLFVVFFETPANPTMKLTDIKAVSDIAHEKGSQVAVDNTFMTPYFQRPLSLGADVVGTSSFISSTRHTAKNIGGALSPFNAWLIIRGMKTLAVRMDRHNSNAMDVPLFLNALKLCTLAVSLGETATLVQHPASMTHAVIPRENRLKYGIPDELVRMSVGLEDVEDIIADVKQALEYI
jgi:methionine-gamma-lyase